MNIFDFGVEEPINVQTYKKTFKKDEEIPFFEAFAGIGCQAMAAKTLPFKFKYIGISEIDKYAITSYNAIHGEIKNYGDISKIEELPYSKICTWSFPCQDISNAGKQKGMKEGTKSNYGYDFLAVVERTKLKPKVLIMENVKALFTKKFEKDLQNIYMVLKRIGYKTFTKVLNAKDYGVAQNRERIFMVSILITDDDPNPEYEFPLPIKLKKRLRDYLEENVDEKYYLSDKTIKTCGCRNREQKIIDIKSQDKYSAKPNSEIAPTQYAQEHYAIIEEHYIRKLTPLECWRLMGINDEDFYKAQSVCSNSQLYKQAGNGIVVDVFAAILKNLFELGEEDGS